MSIKIQEKIKIELHKFLDKTYLNLADKLLSVLIAHDEKYFWCFVSGTKALEDAGISYDQVQHACVGYVYGKL